MTTKQPNQQIDDADPQAARRVVVLLGVAVNLAVRRFAVLLRGRGCGLYCGLLYGWARVCLGVGRLAGNYYICRLAGKGQKNTAKGACEAGWPSPC